MSDTTQTRRKRIPAADAVELRQRVLNIWTDIPSNFIDLIVLANPAYDNPKDRLRIRNVRHLYTTDADITSHLERVANEYREMLGNLQAKVAS